MWEECEATWRREGIVEFGVHQIDTRAGTPTWRRHKSFRFETVWNALFSNKGARAACLGTSHYPRVRYASGDQLFVPYAATWLRGAKKAYLVRASANDPEVTLVDAADIDSIEPASHQKLLEELSVLFGQGAEHFGIRWLRKSSIAMP